MSISLADVQRAGFPMGGEPLVALDLVDTKMLVTDPPQDLIADPAAARAWWALQSARLPGGPAPDLAATRRLRTALRDLFDAHLEGRAPEPGSLDDVNAAVAAVPTSLRLALGGAGYREETRWHTEQGGNAALAATARGAIELLADPPRLARLRRCANPTCSMLFLAETTRRQWCTPNICGNRTRVARHYARTHHHQQQR
ncbi:CGNR zinc finger domain-containing protein [Asanoa siamensis]|uniref:Zinc finger CGNR domain-containing protein n=1 Tax=Asanoa siamensis TaxID=926357 RepID=A0ABQ4CKQ2_9ACTN|nr:ABATE domain-containing protein [Asanoa siamensis]GIF71422.1 hypothetical protein Asi02nite_09400 [Asanoa siamensis]